MSVSNKRPTQLEDLPNIGKAIAADLRALGVLSPEELASHEPLATYQALAIVMGKRLDPCVLYTLLAVAHFQKTGERLPWWHFTAQGKQLL
ncbi:MAG: helix-hairpin-helix domain-containing protein [Rhodoferax sp.]|uniref:helix-hairpin-helix domain-containing protein n=1 Tax=Rhodoferax sp. TaxID=50421 RepID=UPI0026220BFA|nr:helix-hairpin-helix domain-containing protein [Rhodoferax sp.]MDD2882161.1 helix-hairpin-helix domain-containing protein [Rhodoferax sp.]